MIMGKKVTPEKVITFTWLSVAATCCWPLSKSATKYQTISYIIYRAALFVSVWLLFLPLVYAVYLHHDDGLIVAKAGCLTIAMIHIITQAIYTTMQYNRMQRLIEEMKTFCKEAKEHEMDVLEEYVENYSKFYAGCIIGFYACAAFISLGALASSQSFPTEAEYPFTVDYQPLKLIIFIHQSFVGIQCAANISVNAFGALFIWFSAARYEILTRELRTVTEISKLIECMQEHEEIKRYATEVSLCFRHGALLTVILSTCATTFSVVTIMSKQELTIKLQFLSLSLIGLLELFMYAWPAQHLMDVSENVATGAYESNWYMEAVNLQKNILSTLVPQKPVTLSVECIMPTLSLSYYCSYLSNTLTVFTAMRAFLIDEEEN